MQGKGKRPLPLHPIPKTNTNTKINTNNKIKVVYTEDWTHPFIINMFIERTSQILIPPITLIRVREGICFGLYSVAIVGVRARAKDLLPSMLQLFRRWLTIAKASRLPCSQ